ncbi:MAG: hypothetical protein KF884_08815 [Fimbriimonadaceae bacterium]|nr:hypothetical protein [Fimbriimonadaceae bacterium]QYK57650.1 MAG: hypothetical protein KF884_08815 [Fimbriimonadaceae bacterium]
MFELLVGLMLLAVTVVMLFGMTTALSGTGRQTEARAVAMSIARRQMEILLSTSQGNRIAVTDRPFAIDESLRSQFPVSGEDALRGVYSISQPSKKSNLQTLTVAVKWRNLASGDQSKGQGESWSSVTLVRVASSAVDLSGSPYDGSKFESDSNLFADSGSTGPAGLADLLGDIGALLTGITAPLQGIGSGSGGQGALTGMYGSKQR